MLSISDGESKMQLVGQSSQFLGTNYVTHK